MAFGIFGKKEEKMAPPKMVKPASRPSAPDVSKMPPEAAKPAPPPADDDDLESLDFTGIQLVEEKDPVEATAEEAAIAFANQDVTGCIQILQDGRQAFADDPLSEPLWLMLFDAYRLSGNRDAFVPLEAEYARRFLKQPPVWKDRSVIAAPAAALTPGATLFKGDLVGSNTASLQLLAQAVDNRELPVDKLRYEFGKVTRVDQEGCERLLTILDRGRKIRRPVELCGCEQLMKLLEPSVQAREPHPSLWRMLLECYQRLGRQEPFEEVALEFAITFEISPPSYEAPPASAKKAPSGPARVAEKGPSDGAFALRGDVLGGGKIDGLEAYLAGRERAVIDMSEVTRMDFSSAGVLYTAAQAASAAGTSVILRYPNYLVIALLKVVGVADIAQILPAKV